MYRPNRTMRTPPPILIQSRYSRKNWPAALKDAPKLTKTAVKPAMNGHPRHEGEVRREEGEHARREKREEPRRERHEHAERLSHGAGHPLIRGSPPRGSRCRRRRPDHPTLAAPRRWRAACRRGR